LHYLQFFLKGKKLLHTDPLKDHFWLSKDPEPESIMADEYVLKQNYPNPFNPDTKIEFTIPASEHVSVNVYNLEGRLIKTLINQEMRSGQHVVRWNGTNQVGTKVGTGMYIYQLKTNSRVLNRRMTFVK